MLGTGSGASGKSCSPLRLLRLLQPERGAAKPWCCWALLKGLPLAWLRRFPVAEVAMQALLFRALPPSVTRPRFCLVDDFTLLHGDIGICGQINRQAAFLFTGGGDYRFLCSRGLCKFIPACKKATGEALPRVPVARRGFQPPSRLEVALFHLSKWQGEVQLLVWRTQPRGR